VPLPLIRQILEQTGPEFLERQIEELEEAVENSGVSLSDRKALEDMAREARTRIPVLQEDPVLWTDLDSFLGDV
jgi:hypothetical protein